MFIFIDTVFYLIFSIDNKQILESFKKLDKTLLYLLNGYLSIATHFKCINPIKLLF